MSYTIYSEFSYQEIFTPEQVNGFLDHIFTLLINRYGKDDVFKGVFIDGQASKAIQNIPYKGLNSVDVSFNNTAFYMHIIATLESMYWLNRIKLSTSYVVTIAGVPVVFKLADFPIITINNIPVSNQNLY